MIVSLTVVCVLFASICTPVFVSITVIVKFLFVVWYCPVLSVYIAVIWYVPGFVNLYSSFALVFVIFVVLSVLFACLNVTCPFFIGLLYTSWMLISILSVFCVVVIVLVGLIFTYSFVVVSVFLCLLVFFVIVFVIVVVFFAPVYMLLGPVTTSIVYVSWV